MHISLSSHESWSFDSILHAHFVFINPSDSFDSSFPSSTGLPKLCLLLDETLQLILSAATSGLSWLFDEDYTRLEYQKSLKERQAVGFMAGLVSQSIHLRLFCLQMMMYSGSMFPITRSLRVTFIDSMDYPLHYITFPLKCHQFQLFTQYFLYYLPNWCSLFPNLPIASYPPGKSILFPFQREMLESYFSLPYCLASLGLWILAWLVFTLELRTI